MDESAPLEPAAADAPSTSRRPELDWLRVLAFGLLIPFHVGLGFLPTNPYGFSNNDLAGHGTVAILLWMHQWRLPLLFLVAGIGTSVALRHRTLTAFSANRTRRLLVPLVAASLLVLPVHTYLVLVLLGRPEAGDAGFVRFWIDWAHDTLLLPRLAFQDPHAIWTHLQHLWFLLNLFLYSLLLVALIRLVPPSRQAPLATSIDRLLSLGQGRGLFVLALPLVAIEVLFKPQWRGDVGTGYEFPWYLLVFLYGVALASRKETFWNAVQRARWPATILGAASMAAFTATLVLADEASTGYGTLVAEGGWYARGKPWIDIHSVSAMVLHSVNAWSWVVAIVGWAAHLLRRSTPSIVYLNGAVYTSYIVHMSFVLVGLAWLRTMPAWWPFKLVAITLLAAAGVLVVYEVVRRTRPTRLLFAAQKPPAKGDPVSPPRRNP